MSKKKILIVEDDKDIAQLVRYNLEKAGFACETALSGEAALTRLARHPADLLILDVMLPGMDGLEVCRRIRQDPERRRTPVLMLTAKGEEMDRVVGLELGADDYMVKPFSPRELVLRVKVIFRHGEDDGASAEVFRMGELTVDVAKVCVSVKNRPLDLTPKEFELLVTLMRAKGRVLSREQLLDAIWGYDQAVGIRTRTVDVHIRTLRKKLKAEAARIVTAKGYGYRFETGED